MIPYQHYSPPMVTQQVRRTIVEAETLKKEVEHCVATAYRWRVKIWWGTVFFRPSSESFANSFFRITIFRGTWDGYEKIKWTWKPARFQIHCAKWDNLHTVKWRLIVPQQNSCLFHFNEDHLLVDELPNHRWYESSNWSCCKIPRSMIEP